jgi:hypothetical protein
MRRLLAALLAGVVVGSFAAAIATGSGTRKAAATATPTPTPAPAAPVKVKLGPPKRPADRLPGGGFNGGYTHFLVDRGSLRLSPRVADPDGGPGWAVRTFTGQRMSIRGDQPTLAHPVYRQRMRCAELVRTFRGRSGWVFGNRFRATTPGAPGQLIECGSRAHPKPIALFKTILTLIDTSEPQIAHTVAFGLTPPGTSTVKLNDRELPLGRGGGFLALLAPDQREDDLVVEFSLRGGGTARAPLAPPEPDDPASLAIPVQDRLTPIPETERAEARAPDPAGGARYAVLAVDTKEGPTCVGQSGQVVGDRVGWIDATYGLFTPMHLHALQCVEHAGALTRKEPCAINWGGGGLDDPAQPPPLTRRARIERRIGEGRFQIVAACRDDVESVTIQTPRDLRTLVPSARAHVVFALYDATFPTGEAVLTAHFEDGGEAVQKLPTAP